MMMHSEQQGRAEQSTANDAYLVSAPISILCFKELLRMEVVPYRLQPGLAPPLYASKDLILRIDSYSIVSFLSASANYPNYVDEIFT